MVCLTSVRANGGRPGSCTDTFVCCPLVVDSALEIVDAYQRKIVDLEHRVLLQPKMTTVKQREHTTRSDELGLP